MTHFKIIPYSYGILYVVLIHPIIFHSTSYALLTSSANKENQNINQIPCEKPFQEIVHLNKKMNPVLSFLGVLSPCCETFEHSYATESLSLEAGTLFMPVKHAIQDGSYSIAIGQPNLIKSGEISIQPFSENFLLENRAHAEKVLCDNLSTVSSHLLDRDKCKDYGRNLDYLSYGRTSTVYIMYDQQKTPLSELPKASLIKTLRANGFTDLSNLQATYDSYWRTTHGTHVVKAIKLRGEELSKGIRRDIILDHALEQISNHFQLLKDGKKYSVVRIAKSEPLESSLKKGLIVQEAVHGVSLAALHTYLTSDQPVPPVALKKVGIENLADAKTYFQAVTHFYNQADLILAPFAKKNEIVPLIEDRFNPDGTQRIDVSAIIDQNRGHNTILSKNKETGQPKWVIIDR